MRLQKSILLSICFLISFQINAVHIIGGEFSYECLGSTNPDSIYFEITYNVFVNCGQFDPEAVLYLLSTSSSKSKVIEIYFDHLELLENAQYPCTLLPPNLCVQEWVYKSQIELPINYDTLVISYSDCCRPGASVNITGDEDEDFGASHFIEILPNSIEVCNNSPSFGDFPPTYICANEFFELDQIAIDDDGDQLIYEFCEVYSIHSIWGWNIPPFPPIQYLLPDFSFLHPLGQDVLNIDPNSGTITGIPQTVGSFVLGICVSEYRNGQFLGTVRRDIQLNIGLCSPAVEAKIDGGILQSSGEYTINSCFDNEILFANLSIDSLNISSVIWNFTNSLESISDTTWNPLIEFPAGTYNSNLILNPNGECSDTLNFIVNVVEDIIPDFEATYDTCISGPVQFSNNSYAFGSELALYEWDFGDSTMSNDIAPQKIYENPGTFDVQLKITDEFGCTDSLTSSLDWRPAPAILIVSPETAADCAPLSTTFNNLSWPIDSTYSFSWDFGDGSVASNNMSPRHEYLQVGNYDVTISVESPIGCYVDTVFQDLIIVEAPPVANFDFNPMQLSQFNSTIDLIDYSERAVNWQWVFDDFDNSLIQEPTYTFADTGLHTIQLIVQDFYGCADTLLQIVDVVPEVTYFLPNAFSPNGDGNNDVFQAKGFVDAMLSFQMVIFDRWGSVLFSTTDPYFEWRGVDQQSGRIVPKGVYVYQVNYTTNRGRQHQENGYVTVVK